MRATMSAIVVVGLLATSSGCAGLHETSRPTTADCTLQLRIDDDVYSQRGNLERTHRGKLLGLADASDCSDVGPDSLGSYFPEDPRSIRVWAVPGFESSEVGRRGRRRACPTAAIRARRRRPCLGIHQPDALAAAAGVLDELELFVAPIALGSGTPLPAPDGPYGLGTEMSWVVEESS